MKAKDKYHIYSFPYKFEHFLHLNSSFPGGMFHNVRYLLMINARLFEHQLVQIISESFPFLDCLYIDIMINGKKTRNIHLN